MKKVERKEVLKLLNEVSNQINWEKEKHLLGDRVIDSLMLVSIVSVLSDRFDIEFDFELITPENMDSLDAITNTVNQIING